MQTSSTSFVALYSGIGFSLVAWATAVVSALDSLRRVDMLTKMPDVLFLALIVLPWLMLYFAVRVFAGGKPKSGRALLIHFGIGILALVPAMVLVGAPLVLVAASAIMRHS